MVLTEKLKNKEGLLLAVPVAVGCTLILVGIAIAGNYENKLLRASLSRWTVLSLELAFFLLAAGLLLGCREIFDKAKSLSSSTRWWIGILIVSSVVLVTLLPKTTSRILFDEQIYQNIAQGIAHQGKALMCNHGEILQDRYFCLGGEYNKEPNGFPYWLAIFFRLFGVSESSAHLASAVSYVIGVVSVFVLGSLLFSGVAAIAGAALFALTPMVLIWAGTTAADPTAASFAVMSLAACSWYLRAPSLGSALFLAGAGGLAIQIRPESILLVAVMAALLLLVKPREFLEPRLYWTGALLLFFVIVECLHLYAVRTESWGSSGQKFSFQLFLENIEINGPFYYRNERFPALFSLLAIAGVISAGLRRPKAVIALWFLYTWGIFLFFYAGSYDYGADVRFSVISAAPLAILGGLGLSWAGRRLCGLGIESGSAYSVLIFLVLFAWIPFLPLIRASTMEGWQARTDVEISRQWKDSLPADSLVLTQAPSMWLVWGKNAAQTSMGHHLNGDTMTNAFKRYTGGVFFHYGFWCNTDSEQDKAVCREILDHYPVELLKEHQESGLKLALYRLSPPA